MQVTYNSELLKAINDLTIINDRLAINKEDEEVNIKASDEAHLIMYHLSAPLENLNLSDTIAFFDYSRFYNKFSMFENPTLEIDEGNITCKSGNRVATHNLASTSVIGNAFNKINIPSIDMKFKLTAEMIKNFKDLTSSAYFDSNRITLDFNNDVASYKCHSTKHANTFTDDLTAERVTEEKFDVTIDAKVLSLIPSANYDVSVSSAGIMEMAMERTDNISVKLYVARVAE